MQSILGPHSGVSSSAVLGGTVKVELMMDCLGALRESFHVCVETTLATTLNFGRTWYSRHAQAVFASLGNHPDLVVLNRIQSVLEDQSKTQYTAVFQ
jgi:hypothetical protein